jgi:hypothetical protein
MRLSEAAANNFSNSQWLVLLARPLHSVRRTGVSAARRCGRRKARIANLVCDQLVPRLTRLHVAAHGDKHPTLGVGDYFNDLAGAWAQHQLTGISGNCRKAGA